MALEGIDPKDAGTIVSIVVDDLPRPAAAVGRQVVVVRVMRQLPVRVDDLPAGKRVRPQDITGLPPRTVRHRLAMEYVTFAATYQRYDATRIVRELQGKFADRLLVRVSTVRALMASVQLPSVRETTEYEEAL